MNGGTWVVQAPTWLIDLVAEPAHIGNRFYTHMEQFFNGDLLSMILPLALTLLVLVTVLATCMRNKFLRITDAMAPSRRPKLASDRPTMHAERPALAADRPAPAPKRRAPDLMEAAR